MGLCPLKRINTKETPLPLLFVSSKQMNSHSLRPGHSAYNTCVTTATGGGSVGWRIKRTMQESLMSFFSLVVAHWYGSHKRERSCYSSYFILPGITELHLMCTVLLPSFTGWFVEALKINVLDSTKVEVPLTEMKCIVIGSYVFPIREV